MISYLLTLMTFEMSKMAIWESYYGLRLNKTMDRQTDIRFSCTVDYKVRKVSYITVDDMAGKLTRSNATILN